MKTRDSLVNEVASLIINNRAYKDKQWDSVSVTIRFELPSIWKGGIIYFDDDYESEPPRGFELPKKMVELRDLMTQEDGNEWVCCLIKISAKEQSIDIDFEYDDPKRWYLTPTLDPDELRAYAMSIR